MSLERSPGWPLGHDDQRLLAAAEVLASTIESQVETATRPEDGVIADAVLIGAFHVARAARCMRATIALSRAGYAVESAAVVRTLLEDAASLRYLSLKPGPRAHKWLRFDETRSLEYWRLSEQLELGIPKSERIEKLEERGARGNPVWWSGKSPSVMAREARSGDEDLSRTFRALYPWLSDVAHANVKTTVNYYFTDADGSPVLRVGPSDHLVSLMVTVMADLAIKVCEIAQDLGARTDLAEIKKAHAAVTNVTPPGPAPLE